jgi:hypothetical protein
MSRLIREKSPRNFELIFDGKKIMLTPAKEKEIIDLGVISTHYFIRVF